jgi:hypothetical protein
MQSLMLNGGNEAFPMLVGASRYGYDCHLNVEAACLIGWLTVHSHSSAGVEPKAIGQHAEQDA